MPTVNIEIPAELKPYWEDCKKIFCKECTSECKLNGNPEWWPGNMCGIFSVNWNENDMGRIKKRFLENGGKLD